MIRATLFLIALYSPALFAGEKVVLKNGQTYEVETKNGMPQPIETAQIRIKGIGPMFGPYKQTGIAQLHWLITANIKTQEVYKLLITTPIDPSIRKIFRVQGPCEIQQPLFSESETPAAWTWLKEPGDTWFPFELSFQANDPKDSFQITQWAKFDSNSKTALIRIFEAMSKSKK